MAENYKYRKVRQENEQPRFILSTTDVKEYLQLRLDMIVAGIRKSGETYKDLPNIQVEVFGTQASDKYVPMLVILPPAVLVDESSNDTSSIPGIYFNRDEDSHMQLIDEIGNFFKIYSFTKPDLKAFMSQNYLHAIGISTREAQKILNFSEPRYRVHVDKDGNNEHNVDMVMFYIDPLRVFHEMLEIENDTRKFRIEITNIKKIRDTQYNYHIKKQYEGKKKKYKNSMYREFDSMLKRVN